MLKNLTLAMIIIFCSQVLFAQEQIPELNQEIVAYVKTTIGTKVNRGECWDLAAEALNRNDAQWNKEYEFGEAYNPKTKDVLPGDLIQFENVKLQYTEGNKTTTETMGHHSAIIYRVIDQQKKIFELAHQNTGFSGRKVGLSTFNLNYVTRGSLIFYRPVPRD